MGDFNEEEKWRDAVVADFKAMQKRIKYNEQAIIMLFAVYLVVLMVVVGK
jgi:hypothetical protein